MDHRWALDIGPQYGPSMDPRWNLDRPSMDPRWTLDGPSMDPRWTLDGPSMDPREAFDGPSRGIRWTLDKVIYMMQIYKVVLHTSTIHTNKDDNIYYHLYSSIKQKQVSR